MVKFYYLLVLLCLSLASSFAYSNTGLTKPIEATAQYINDTAITTKVKTSLMADKNISSLPISVTTDNGVVTLRGNVDSATQKELALKIAGEILGVKSVKDELVIHSSQ